MNKITNSLEKKKKKKEKKNLNIYIDTRSFFLKFSAILYTADGNRRAAPDRTGQMSRILNWDDLNNRPVVKSSALFLSSSHYYSPFLFFFGPPLVLPNQYFG